MPPNSCCADLLTEFTHACVLNTRSECEVGRVHVVCVVVMQVYVCMSVCLHGCCGPGFWAPRTEAHVWPGYLQLNRQKDERFPCSSPLHLCPHPDLTVPLSPDVVSSKAGSWELCAEALGCGKGKEASCGRSQSPLAIASLHWLCGMPQATILSTLSIAHWDPGGRSPG